MSSSRPGMGALLLHDVTVVDGTGAPPRGRQAVLVEDGRVAYVGAASSAPPAEGAERVEGGGRFLLPGLWDMHVHSLYPGRPESFFPLFLAHGVTSLRETGSALPLPEIAALRSELESGRRLGPHLRAVAGPLLDAPGAARGQRDFAGVGSAEDARRAVRSVAVGGADFVKVYNGLSREAYGAIAEEAARAGLPFAGHVPWSVTAREASRLGQRVIEHLTGVLFGCSAREEELRARGLNDWSSAEAAVSSHDVTRRRELLRTFRANATAHCPTLGLLRTLGVGPERGAADPRLRYVPPRVRERWRDAAPPLAARDAAAAEGLFALQREVVGAMRGEGVTVVAGSDVGWGNAYTFAGSSLHEELALLVKAGYTPMEAIQAATRDAAALLGLAGRAGTIEAGKDADLVLLGADPLADIRNVGSIEAVVLRGRLLARADLDGLLAEAERAASSL